MANVSRVNGFVPVRQITGAPFNDQVDTYFVTSGNSTAIFVGDAVKLSGNSDVNGIAGVTKATAGDAIVGIMVGIRPVPDNLNLPQYVPATTAVYVRVSNSPETLYEVSTSGTLTANDVGLNVSLADAGGSTATGFSGESIDGSTKSTTATLTFKVFGFVQTPDNDVTSTGAKAIVKINNHQYGAGTGTQGV